MNDTYNFFLIDLMNVDTSGIIVLEELHKRLLSRGIKVSFVNNFIKTVKYYFCQISVNSKKYVI